MSVLVCENLNKKHNKTEIRNFSYNFLDNQIYALLEKNDEYQKQLLNLLCAKEKADSGTVWIDGEKLHNNIEMNERICYISKETTFPKNLKIIQIFKIMSDFYPKWDNAYAYELLKHFNINLNALFTLAFIFINASVIDMIFVANRKVVVTIITEKGDEISDLINSNFTRGVTRIKAIGNYTKREKDIRNIVHFADSLSGIALRVSFYDFRADA